MKYDLRAGQGIAPGLGRYLFIIYFPVCPWAPPNYRITITAPARPRSPPAGGKGAGAVRVAAARTLAQRIFPYNWISLDAAGACDCNPLFYHMAAGWIEI